MGTLLEDIKKQSDWITRILDVEGFSLDYSIKSLMEIDKFLYKYVQDGKPIAGSMFAKYFGIAMFSLSSYLGETLIRNVPNSRWSFDENENINELNITALLNNEVTIFPSRRIIKRVQNGLEDGIYPYGYALAKKYTNEKFDDKYWKIAEEIKPYVKSKAWWKFW
ncbi:MAG TPA: hypothetical protein ENJ95_22000 [Bacteroidetes bacterium]|nr:hypothetical protein [Bacteroidota bacterium]